MSNWRQKAETALRQHDGQNRMNSPGFFRQRSPTSHSSNLFQQDTHVRPTGNTWTSGPIYRTAPMYDNDPKPLADEELESLVVNSTDLHARASQDTLAASSTPPRLPAKDRPSPEKLSTPTRNTKSTVPAWGQRYSSKSQVTATEAKTHVHGSKSMASSRQEEDKDRSAEPEGSHVEHTALNNETSTSDRPSQGPSNNTNESIKKGADGEKNSEPDDDDFVENPFDDDD